MTTAPLRCTVLRCTALHCTVQYRGLAAQNWIFIKTSLGGSTDHRTCFVFPPGALHPELCTLHPAPHILCWTAANWSSRPRLVNSSPGSQSAASHSIPLGSSTPACTALHCTAPHGTALLFLSRGKIFCCPLWNSMTCKINYCKRNEVSNLLRCFLIEGLGQAR